MALAKDCGKRLALWQKESKLKARKSWEVIPRVVEVARGKTGRKLEAYLEPSWKFVLYSKVVHRCLKYQGEITVIAV